METLRNLLGQGNGKLGEGIYTFSLPAVQTCPGSTPTCRRECYATRGRFVFRRRGSPHRSAAGSGPRESRGEPQDHVELEGVIAGIPLREGV